MSDKTVRSMVVCLSTTASLFLCCVAAVAEDRSIDGSGNNVQNPHWGRAGTAYSRVSPPAYGNGISTPSGAERPLPRIVSNAVGQQDALIASDRRLSGFAYAFGQFLNHELELTQGGASEFITITTPSDDPHFHGNVLQPLFRSRFDPNTGLDATNPRQQLNFVTSFIDASSIYGSDQNRADLLRERVGDGLGARLVTSGAENLLPLASTIPVEIAVTGGYAADRTKLYAAGDLRAGENASLATLHTLFMREHNRLVDELAAGHPAWSQEQLYQRARKIVGAELQSVTYNEFLPALLGSHAPSSQAAYDPAVDPSVINEFAGAFLRVGHSMLGNDFRRVLNDGSSGPMDNLRIGETIFNVPQWLNQSSDLDLFLKGLSVEEMQEVDTLFTDENRNIVPFFIDLMSIDVARARDHGLADYNTMRVAYGLPAVTTFSEITTDPALALDLEQLYGDVNRIDPLIGALAEDHLPGASVGPLAAAGFAEQFVRLRDGDRFWYETDSTFTAEEVLSLQNTRLSDIIRRNTGITNLQDNVFFVPSDTNTLPHLWIANANGNWSIAANWNGGVPNGVGAKVVFASASTAARTITVDGPKTVGSLTFDNVNSYTLAGDGPLQINNSGTHSMINVVRGSHTISAPLAIAAGTTLVRSGAGTLTISGAQNHGAGAILNATGGVTNINSDAGANLAVHANAPVNFGSTQNLASLQVGAGATVQMAPGGGKTLVTSKLAIAGNADAPTGKFDLADNSAVIDYSGDNPAATVRQQIVAGRGGAGFGAAWNGMGITSNAVANADPETRSVGYADNSTMPLGAYTNFGGEPVDVTSILMTYTRTADANLDGVVDDEDVTIVGATYAPGVPQAAWALGDFDYNGFVDDDDVTLLGAFYDPSATPIATSNSIAVIPEPSSVAFVAVGAVIVCLLARRRSN